MALQSKIREADAAGEVVNTNSYNYSLNYNVLLESRSRDVTPRKPNEEASGRCGSPLRIDLEKWPFPANVGRTLSSAFVSLRDKQLPSENANVGHCNAYPDSRHWPRIKSACAHRVHTRMIRAFPFPLIHRGTNCTTPRCIVKYNRSLRASLFRLAELHSRKRIPRWILLSDRAWRNRSPMTGARLFRPRTPAMKRDREMMQLPV